MSARFDLASSHALVTGASAGIGRAIARRLGREARGLVLVARRQDRLDELATELRAARPELHVRTRAVDLADPAATARFLESLDDGEPPVDVLVNNAGFGDYGPFEQADWAKLDEMLAVNVRAATRLLHALVPPMVARGRGAVMNLGSVAGFIPGVGGATYAATKAYVNHLSEALRAELVGTGVSVTLVCPGPVPTEFQAVAGSDKRVAGRPPAALAIDADQCAREAVEALVKRRPRVITGNLARTVGVLLEALPKVAVRPVLTRTGRKMRSEQT